MIKVVDRVVEHENRYRLTRADTGEEWGVFDVEEITGTVTQQGTEINAELFQSIQDDITRLEGIVGDAYNPQNLIPCTDSDITNLFN